MTTDNATDGTRTQITENVETISDLQNSWKVASPQKAKNLLYNYLDGDRVVKLGDQDIIPTVKIYVRNFEEFKQMVNEFFNEPEVARYGHFITAREYVRPYMDDEDKFREAELHIDVEWTQNSKALDRADFSELDVEVEDR